MMGRIFWGLCGLLNMTIATAACLRDAYPKAIYFLLLSWVCLYFVDFRNPHAKEAIEKAAGRIGE